MITKKLLKNIEALWDYSQDLKIEIESAIIQLSDQSYLHDEILHKLITKLETAKKNGLNIENINEVISTFKESLEQSDIKSNIKIKLEQIKNASKLLDFEINEIKEEYEQLVKNWNENKEIDELFKNLIEIQETEKLIFKIKKIHETWEFSPYDFEKIMKTVKEFKEKWYNTKIIETLIMGDEIDNYQDFEINDNKNIGEKNEDSLEKQETEELICKIKIMKANWDFSPYDFEKIVKTIKKFEEKWYETKSIEKLIMEE